MQFIPAGGGGFLFRPFSRTQVYGPIIAPASMVLWMWGPWVHPAIPQVTTESRWVSLVNYWTDGSSRAGRFQLGIGPAGSETIWLPNNDTAIAIEGNKGTFDYNIDANQPSVPYVITFPFSVAPGLDISVRHRCSLPGAINLHTIIYLWG
jgi:hypothetical protein